MIFPSKFFFFREETFEILNNIDITFIFKNWGEGCKNFLTYFYLSRAKFRLVTTLQVPFVSISYLAVTKVFVGRVERKVLLHIKSPLHERFEAAVTVTFSDHL